MSEEPLTVAAEAAAATHELFQTLVASGFTESQAIQFVVRLMIEQGKS